MTNLRVANTHAHLIDCEVWPKKFAAAAFGSIIDANTMCTVTDGHVQLPANAPCIQKRVAVYMQSNGSATCAGITTGVF